MSSLQKLLALLTPQEQRRGMLILAMVVGMALLETVGVASVMPFLAVVGDPKITEENAYLSAAYHFSRGLGVSTVDEFLIVLGGFSFGLIVLSAIYRTLTQYALMRFTQMRRYTISARLLMSYLRQPYSFFLDRHSGDLSKTILSEVDQLIGLVLRPFVLMIANVVVAVFIIVLLVVVDPLVASVVAVSLTVIYGLIYATLRKFLRRLGAERVRANEERFTATAEAFAGIKEIKLLGREHTYMMLFKAPSLRFAQTSAVNATVSLVPNYLVEALVFGGIVSLTLWLILAQGSNTSGSLGEVLPLIGLYAFAAYRLKPAASVIYGALANLRFAGPCIDEVSNDLAAGNESSSKSFERPEAMGVREEICLKNLSYSYPNASRLSLENISLQIPVGTSVGLVGSTGAGKTTLVDILLGLLMPTEGFMTVDGQTIIDENLASWQESLGYVPQAIFLADATIAENIAFGVPAEEVDHERVAQCARMAQIHDFVMDELPRQYETMTGERGIRLSGGQRQRIGIARALYNEPQVLVFDEATSALDSDTEQAVMESIDSLALQKTVVLIAHRLGTVRHCDKVVLMDQGRIVKEGSFDQLVGSDSEL